MKKKPENDQRWLVRLDRRKQQRAAMTSNDARRRLDEPIRTLVDPRTIYLA